MVSSFLVPFTLRVKLSELCASFHEELCPLFSLLPQEEGVSSATTPTTHSVEANREKLHHLIFTNPVSSFSTAGEHSKSAAVADFIAATHRSLASERAYVHIVFQEYCRRKNIEKERETLWTDCEQELKLLQETEPPSKFLALLNFISEQESAARDEVVASHKLFMEEMKAAYRTTKAGRERAALREEGGHSPMPASEELWRGYKDGIEDGVHEATNEALRRQAITMIEHEYEHRLRSQEAQIESLWLQEEQLRRTIERKRLHTADPEERHAEEMELRYRCLMEQENSIRERLSQQHETWAQRDIVEKEKAKMEREQLYEHVEAEEELLRQRLRRWEEARAAEAEAEKRKAEEQREQLYEHVEAEEELLRQRLRRWEEARAAEAEAEKRKAEEQREQLYEHVRAEEEILRRRLEQGKRVVAEEVDSKAVLGRERKHQESELLEYLVMQENALEEQLRRRDERLQSQNLQEMEKNQQHLYFAQQQPQIQQMSCIVGGNLGYPLASAAPSAECMWATSLAPPSSQPYVYQYPHQQQHQHLGYSPFLPPQ